MEMNVVKTKVMRISRQGTPIQIMIHKKSTGEFGIFHLFGKHNNQMMQDVLVKLNPGWPWQKQHSTRRFFPPANCT